jgi:predicted XRE-type DNA-binding protein
MRNVIAFRLIRNPRWEDKRIPVGQTLLSVRHFCAATIIQTRTDKSVCPTAAAARRLRVNQPKISALSNYQVDGFSVERLMNLLTALDRDVDIVIRPKPRSRKVGRIAVRAA